MKVRLPNGIEIEGIPEEIRLFINLNNSSPKKKEKRGRPKKKEKRGRPKKKLK